MTTPLESIAKLCLLPELKLIQVVPPGFFVCEKGFRCRGLSSMRDSLHSRL